ncbi:hypothetical protein AYO20_01136 [Fonsecaea nubica]|uniref:Uncharacterized protein n=1 Tax=Fonsecaea nubica TaxID=856822 RepID=A0A178DC35_9EURO|nr:hypothetical protein AYO20_01136 [Fonsecaea nubica]OAL39739.1 hypothetical protein AYO20_01136 [Fonsecaea nubica]
MDPASLALSILTSYRLCTEGYKVIVSMRHASTSAIRIQCKCEIEEARFLLWGKSWGLVDDLSVFRSTPNVQLKLVKEPVAISQLVAKILSEIENILGNATGLKKKYGLSDLLRTETANEEDASEEPALEPNYTGSMSLKKRISWSTRDKSSFEELVADLRELNNGLYSLVPIRSQSLLTEALNAEILPAKDQPRDLEILKEVSEQADPQLSDAVELKLLGLKANSCETTWNANASVKLSKAGFRFQTPDGLSEHSDNLASSSMSYASFTPKGADTGVPVLIEWKPYDPRATGSRAFVIALRAEGLCRLLEKFSATSLSVPSCLGFFDDVDGGRFGFTFPLPQTPLYGGLLQPANLNDLISGQPALPPLEDRFKLASTLARTLFAFHCSEWLHKDFSSHNILLGTLPGNNSSADLTQPFVVGFTYSRPEDHEGVSSEIRQTQSLKHLLYQHPSLLLHSTPVAPRYCKAFDLWSLGCVLLEIGLWRRLKDLWKPKYAENPTTWTDRLRNVWVGELRGRCGGQYEHVVTRCLSASEQDFESSGLFWEIIGKLEELRV